MEHYSVEFTDRLLKAAGIRAGMRVLDVGCGLGDVSYLAASLVGPAGLVVGVDRNASALALARSRAFSAKARAPTFVHADIDALPNDLKDFDAVIGRRVLMYQQDQVGTLYHLSERLTQAGLMVFQEADMSMLPARIEALPLHETALGWLRRMLEIEGADLKMGFRLYDVLSRAGMVVEGVRAEAIVQTPTQPSPLGSIISAVWPRIVEQRIATEQEIGVDTFQERLDAERLATSVTYIGDMMFGAWARKPSLS